MKKFIFTPAFMQKVQTQKVTSLKGLLPKPKKKISVQKMNMAIAKR